MNSLSAEMLGDIFAQALQEVIAKTTGFSLDVLSSEQDAGFDESIALMSLNSMKGGILFISSEEESMRTLCSFMEGDDKDEITKADMDDVLCEFLNMTAGNAKMRLNDTEYMFTLSSPLIISGNSISLAAKTRVSIISRTLGNGNISIRLKVVF